MDRSDDLMADTLTKEERELERLRKSQKPATIGLVMETVEAAADPLVTFMRAQAERIGELEATVADLRRKMEADG